MTLNLRYSSVNTFPVIFIGQLVPPENIITNLVGGNALSTTRIPSKTPPLSGTSLNTLTV